MATREMVKDLLISLNNMWNPRKSQKKIDLITDDYYRSLKEFSRKELADAYDKCIDDLEKFPYPKHIRERIIHEEKDNSKFTIEGGHRCGSCGETERLCIDEPKGSKSWRCRPCYTGMSDLEIKAKFGELLGVLEGRQ